MSILISSQTAAATSNNFYIADKAVIMASSNIASGEDCVIESHSEIDGWIDTLEVLSSTEPVSILEGPCTYRMSKPTSSAAYGVEIKANISSDIVD